ncbi:D-inositol 3-phosphate glycosyltransferase, partial [Stylophora pistillata]
MASSTAFSAARREEEEEQRLIDVMFLCDEWKSSKGGLSTFNREFAINLAETTIGRMKIHCYVSKSDDQDREDAKQHGVNLITAGSVPGSSDPLECLKYPPSELPNPQLVIGHGRKLGNPAYSLVRHTKCKWIQFVHVYCEDLGKYKKTTTAATDTIEENEKKHQMEIELCKVADAVVAVGSRLQQKYSRNLLKVEMVTPGIFGKFSNESQLAVDRSVVKNFSVFVFGRATFEDLSLKGYDIIANAIGSLGKKFELIFVGSSPGEHQKVEQWFLDNTCINRSHLTIRGYCNDPEELKMMYYQSDLVALPSRTEGFGLVALEAISAGIPILVSGESGIAEALREVEGGNTVIVELDEDADEWARRIREMSEESAEEREAKARRLRENYRKVYSWRAECERFKGMIEKVVENANGIISSEFHSKSSTSESLQKQEELKKWERKTKIVETEKMKGTSLSTKLSIAGHGKELEGKLKTLKLKEEKSTWPVPEFSASDPEEELAELRLKLQGMEARMLFSSYVESDNTIQGILPLSEEEPEGLLMKLQRRKGILPLSEEELEELLMKLQSMKGSSPSVVLPSAGQKKDLEGRQKTMKIQGEKGSLPSSPLSTTDLEEKLEEVCVKLMRLRKEDLRLYLDGAYNSQQTKDPCHADYDKCFSKAAKKPCGKVSCEISAMKCAKKKLSAPPSKNDQCANQYTDSVSCTTNEVQYYKNLMAMSQVPKLWKHANITPIHKDGDREPVEYYRGISLLSIAGKCQERLVYDAIYEQVIDFIHCSHHGFLRVDPVRHSSLWYIITGHYDMDIYDKLLFCKDRSVDYNLRKNDSLDLLRISTVKIHNDPEELKLMFYQSDLVALPSRTEGFGLVALEAISAGIPILVSGESGLAEALREVEGGNTVIVEFDEDADEWARRIREMAEESAEEREAKARRLRENYREVYSWRTECEKFKGMIEKVVENANDGKLNVKVDVKDLKHEEQSIETAILATESVRGREVQQPRAPVTSAVLGSMSYLQTEQKIFLSIAENCLQTTPPQSWEEHNKFLDYLKEVRVVLAGTSIGSLVMTVKCESVMILEGLWTDYLSGHLGEVVQNSFVTEKILKELNLVELKLKTTIDEEEYIACKVYFEKVALRDALSAQSYSTGTEGEAQLERWKQNTDVVESEKVKSSLPIFEMSTTGHNKEGEEPQETMKGSLPSSPLSTTDLEEKLEEVCVQLMRLRKEGSSPILEMSTTGHNKEGEEPQETMKVRLGCPTFSYRRLSGLVALEAISAAVPVLVSGESGIAEALRKVEGGRTVIVGSYKDVDEARDEWARRIREMSEESAEEREANARKLCENYRKVYSWKAECTRFKEMIESVMESVNDGESNITVDVKHVKPADDHSNAPPVEPAVPTMEPNGERQSDTDLGDLQLLKEKILCRIAMNYLDTTPPRSSEEHNKFMEYLEKMRVVITGVSVGSLVITVKCDSLTSLEELWENYSCGLLDKMVQDCFVTENILKELNLAELKLKTTMDIEEYNACKLYFEKDAVRGLRCFGRKFGKSVESCKTGHGRYRAAFNKKKCAVAHVKRGVLQESTGMLVGEHGLVKSLEKDSQYKFLGVLENTKQEDTLVLQNAARTYLRRLSVIWSSPLSDHFKVVATNQLALPVLTYFMWTQVWPIAELQRIDRDTRKVIAENGGKHPLDSVMNLRSHINSICKSSFLAIRNIGRVRILPPSEEELDELLMKLQSMKDTSLSTKLSTAGHGKELEGKLKTMTLQEEKLLYSVSTFEVELKELPEKLQEMRLKGTVICSAQFAWCTLVVLGICTRVKCVVLKEGAWQLVLLFTDELPSEKLPEELFDEMLDVYLELYADEDEDEEVFSSSLYSSKSGILKAWPIEHDPDWGPCQADYDKCVSKAAKKPCGKVSCEISAMKCAKKKLSAPPSKMSQVPKLWKHANIAPIHKDGDREPVEHYYESREGTSDLRPQTEDLRPQTSDFRLQTSDFRLQTSDFRLQTSDFRLQNSDLIKEEIPQCTSLSSVLSTAGHEKELEGRLKTFTLQEEKQCQKASIASGAYRKRPSDTDLEDLQPLEKKVLCLIAMNYLPTTPPEGRDEHSEFQEYLRDMKVHITCVSVGIRLVITVKCDSLKSLEELWEDYSCGLLGKMVRDCFVTEKILKALNLAELKLKTTMDIEEYNACKLYFEKNALKGILPLSEEPEGLVMKLQRMKGTWPVREFCASDPEEDLAAELPMKLQGMEVTSPSAAYLTTGHEKEKKGTSLSTKLSTVGHGKELEGKLKTMKLQEEKSILPLSEEEPEGLLMKLQRMKGSLVITVKCDSLKSLEELWEDYSCGLLSKMVRDCFVTEKILKELNLAELKLKTTMDIEDYNACKLYFEKDALRGVLSSEFYSKSSTSESLQKQEELKKWKQKTKIVETEKMKGTPPLTVISTTGKRREEEPTGKIGTSLSAKLSTAGHGKELEGKMKTLKLQEEKSKLAVPESSTSHLVKKLAELCMELIRLRMEGTLPPPELFTANFEEELEELRVKLDRQPEEFYRQRYE